jgi:hypothetical protein
MKRARSIVATSAVLALAAAVAHAETFTYTSPEIQQYYVETTGIYSLNAAGAKGGNGTDNNTQGGLGAVLSGDYTLTAGTVLDVVVGGQGGNSLYNGGGGGGSFVYFDSNTTLLLAAGGGGGGGYNVDGSGGQTLQSGLEGHTGGAEGGSNGQEGGGAQGGGGSGWLSGGGNGSGGGGSSYPSFAGGNGPGGGGYGGGGGGGEDGGGGGGGYSGGGGGAGGPGGGGGGSYYDPSFSDLSLSAGSNNGNGLVTIELVPAAVPEPSSLVLMGVGGISALIVARFRRKRVV